MLERYLIPLAPYLLLGLVSIAGLFIAASFDKEIRHLKSALRPAHPNLVTHEELQATLNDFNARLSEAEERASSPAQAKAVGPSLNLNKRNQVLRMSRRGAATDSIAASLCVPRKEVELLLKIHRLASEASS